MLDRRLLLASMLILLGGGLLACGGRSAIEGPRYTTSNIWFERTDKVQSTNYQKGALLPAGTKVRIDGIRKNKYILFTNLETDVQIRLLFVIKHHPGLNFDAYLQRLFGEKDREALLAGFSDAERAAIERGEVEPGMSREAVLVCNGYPPEIGTATLKANKWKYWRNRFVTYHVTFEDDQVVDVGRR